MLRHEGKADLDKARREIIPEDMLLDRKAVIAFTSEEIREINKKVAEEVSQREALQQAALLALRHRYRHLA